MSENQIDERISQTIRSLPADIQNQANAAYRLWKVDPYYPSLHFKRIDPEEPIYSVRIGLHYRAVGTWVGDTIIWDFIGTHEEYNHLL